MQRNLGGELGIERLKRCRVGGVVNGIKPDPLRRRRRQHRRVVGRVERAKTRGEASQALIAVHLQVENLHRQRVARLRSLDVKRPGQRIVALHHG